MNLLHAELRKLLTLPALWLTAALTLAGTALVAYADADPPFYTQAGFLVLGVLAADVEHQTATLLAMPRRSRLYPARVVTLAVLTLPVAAAGTDAVYLTLATLLGFATAVALGHALPAVLVLLGLQFMVSPVLRAAVEDFPALLPDPVDGRAAAVVWTVVALAVAAVIFERRDASSA